MNSIIFKLMMLNEQIKAFRKDEKGVTMIEYGLFASSRCAWCALSALTTLGTDLSKMFTDYRH